MRETSTSVGRMATFRGGEKRAWSWSIWNGRSERRIEQRFERGMGVLNDATAVRVGMTNASMVCVCRGWKRNGLRAVQLDESG